MDPLFQGSLVNARRIIYTPSDFAKNNLLHLLQQFHLFFFLSNIFVVYNKVSFYLILFF